MPQPQLVEPIIQAQLEIISINRNHDAYEVVRNVQQQNIGAHNNIANLVKKYYGSKWLKHRFT
jgi:hypothetical protein